MNYNYYGHRIKLRLLPEIDDWQYGSNPMLKSESLHVILFGFKQHKKTDEPKWDTSAELMFEPMCLNIPYFRYHQGGSK
jgi:hypothetical protein